MWAKPASYQTHSKMWNEHNQGNLCGEEEHFVCDVAEETRGDAQPHPWEHVGVVSLAREELPAVLQGHRVKRTATGEDAPTLIAQHFFFLIMALV